MPTAPHVNAVYAVHADGLHIHVAHLHALVRMRAAAMHQAYGPCMQVNIGLDDLAAMQPYMR
jgi:hypothetical protein